MAQAFFIWNGIDCRSMGITKRGFSPIIRPEERVQHVEIPGKSGDLTETEGEYIFNSYIQTATISAKAGMRVREIYKWLRGGGYVTFDSEPDRRQRARIIGAVTLEKLSRNLDKYVGEIQFYCQPLKEKLHEEKITVTSSGSTVMNTGDVICSPMFKVTVSGSGSGKSISLTVSGNGTPESNTIAVTNLTGGDVIWIDSDAMEVLNADKSALLTVNSAGHFPVMAPGANTITGSGWGSIEIERRERFL